MRLQLTNLHRKQALLDEVQLCFHQAEEKVARMGRLPSCSGCSALVLELEGQFEVLQPYYSSEPNPAREIAGWCHSSCLIASPHRATWTRWMLEHFTGVRGYAEAGVFDGWHALQSRRHAEMLAVHENGGSVSIDVSVLKRAKRVDGGLLLPIQQEMNLEFAERDVVDLIKSKLESEGAIAIVEVLSALEIGDRILWPQALVDARFVDSKKLRRHWGVRHIVVDAHYAQYIPAALGDGVRSLMRAK
jgi:hypothetical protein